MSTFYRLLAFIMLMLAIFMEKTFDGQEITRIDRMLLLLLVFILNIIAKLEEIENLLK